MPTWRSDSSDPAVADGDVVVIGAGPAGLACAVAAARHGARVTVLDGEQRAGGQFWRHGPDGVGDAHHGRQRWRQLTAALDAAQSRGLLRHLPGHRVWRVEAGVAADVGEPPRGGGVVHAVDPAGRARTLRPAALVLAPGSHDRVLPFPGWDLPGVLTAGGAQALLKEHGVRAGRRVLVAGTGPFLLPVAIGLAQAGAQVPFIAEATDGSGWLRGGRAVATAPEMVREGVGYAAALARYRIPLLPRHAVVRVLGHERVEGAVVARLDRDWTVVPGTDREVGCDAVAVGWGFLARLELGIQAGCATRSGADGTPVLVVDAHGRTSVPGVFAAGEVTGVAGARLAVLGGLVAGAAAAAVARGREPAPTSAPVARARARLARFAVTMHEAHRVAPGWVGWLEQDTLVCRCEEVTVGTVRAAAQSLGACDLRSAKLISRAGMGWCQGRMCAEAVSRIVAGCVGADALPGTAADPDDVLLADLVGAANRPVAVPVLLGSLILPGGAHPDDWGPDQALDPPALDPPALDPPALDPPAPDPPALDPPAPDPQAPDPPGGAP